MVGISVSLGDFQLACANCYSLENTKLVRNLFVGVKRNESATSALDTNWLVYFLGKLVYMHKKFEVNWTKIKGGCQTYTRDAPQES